MSVWNNEPLPSFVVKVNTTYPVPGTGSVVEIHEVRPRGKMAYSRVIVRFATSRHCRVVLDEEYFVEDARKAFLAACQQEKQG